MCDSLFPAIFSIYKCATSETCFLRSVFPFSYSVLPVTSNETHTHTPACFPVGHEWLCCFHVCFQNTLAGVVCIAPHPEEQTHLHTHMVDNIQDRLVIDFFFITHTNIHKHTPVIHQNIWLSQHMLSWISVCACWVWSLNVLLHGNRLKWITDIVCLKT